jgi:hypothetical protein
MGINLPDTKACLPHSEDSGRREQWFSPHGRASSILIFSQYFPSGCNVNLIHMADEITLFAQLLGTTCGGKANAGI